MLILKVAICDDDEVYRKDILHHLFEYMFKTDIELSISEYESGDALLSDYHSKGDFDLVFLDVEMPGKNGLKIADEIRNFDKELYIVYVSSYPQYMQDSFKVHPYYYLSKPVTFENIAHVLSDIVDSVKDKNVLYSVINSNGDEIPVNIKRIIYIETLDSKSKTLIFHLNSEKIIGKGTISEWERKLNNCEFYLCNRNTLVSILNVKYIKGNEVVLNNSDVITMSRNKTKELKKKFSKLIITYNNV
jgi:DNA-binding LytR/AlgR family response regulator